MSNCATGSSIIFSPQEIELDVIRFSPASAAELPTLHAQYGASALPGAWDALQKDRQRLTSETVIMPSDNPQFDFDFIVIGSGFGGSVSALRLTEKGYHIGR